MSEPASGLFQSLRRLLDTALGIVEVRLQLLGTEYEQEKRRIVDAFLQAGLGVVMIALALALLIAFVVLLFDARDRLAAVGVMAVLFGAAGGWLVQRARRQLQQRDEGPFALSLGELRRDRQGLGERPPEP